MTARMRAQTERLVSQQRGEIPETVSPNYYNFRALAGLPNHSRQAEVPCEVWGHGRLRVSAERDDGSPRAGYVNIS